MKPIGERVASIEAKQGDFDRWNTEQNGRLSNIDKKLDSIQKWILGIMTSVTLSLIVMVINLVVK